MTIGSWARSSEVLHAMRKGATVPSFERGLVSGCITAARQPSEIEPIERAQLDLNHPGDVDLRDQSEARTWSCSLLRRPAWWRELEAHVVATLIERDDLGIFPLISEPLAVGEAARPRPRRAFAR